MTEKRCAKKIQIDELITSASHFLKGRIALAPEGIPGENPTIFLAIVEHKWDGHNPGK